MTKLISIARILALLSLVLFAIVFVLGEEQGDTAWALSRIVIDKALGIGACILIGRLYKCWSKTDPWIMAYDNKYNKSI